MNRTGDDVEGADQTKMSRTDDENSPEDDSDQTNDENSPSDDSGDVEKERDSNPNNDVEDVNDAEIRSENEFEDVDPGSSTFLEDLEQIQHQIDDLADLVENYESLNYIRKKGAFKELKSELKSLRRIAREREGESDTSSIEIDEPNFIAFDEDTYSIMMISPIFSQYWLLGLMSVTFQWSILISILIDLIVKQSEDSSPLDIPYSVPYEVTIGQYFGIFICVGVQSDVLSSLRMIFAMRNTEENDWDEVIGIGSDNRTWKNWIIHILFPNLIKFMSGLLVLTVNFITIVQSSNIVDLMKDVAALLIISEISEIFFTLASFGFLGGKLEDATELVQRKEVEDKLIITPFFGIAIPLRLVVFLILSIIMGGAVGFFIEGQRSGRYFQDRYPYCDIKVSEIIKFGDGKCEGGIFNTIACDFDGGDCVQFNIQYPNCKAPEPFKIGDNSCDQEYNTPECNYDGSDCCPFDLGNSTDPRYGDGMCDGGKFFAELCEWDRFDCDDFRKNPATLKCDYEALSDLVPFGEEPRLGDKVCDSRVYNTPECLFENGDCVECNEKVFDYRLTGDGVCHGGPHNTDVCNNDAGDCKSFNKRWPRCKEKTQRKFDDRIAIVPIIGDGICNSGLYNNEDCGYEDGDCDICNKLIPDITKIGDGFCDGQEYMSEDCGFDGGDCVGCEALRFEIGNGWCTLEYNTPECSFDGGDCDILQELTECNVEYPSLLGNGYCNGGDYNTPECNFDGGDCLEVKLEGCDEPERRHFLLGDGYCNGFMNTPECNFDGGDCVEFNEKYPDCAFEVLEPALVGNGVCNRGQYNTEDCGWDGGDCVFEL